MSPSFKCVHPCSDRCLVSLDTENSGAGAMHQDFSQVWVPALAYTQQAGLASCGVLPGNKPEPGGKLSSLAQGDSVANCRDDSGGDDRPDPWNLLDAAATGIGISDTIQFLAEYFDLLLDQPSRKWGRPSAQI